MTTSVLAASSGRLALRWQYYWTPTGGLLRRLLLAQPPCLPWSPLSQAKCYVRKYLCRVIRRKPLLAATPVLSARTKKNEEDQEQCTSGEAYTPHRKNIAHWMPCCDSKNSIKY